MANKYYNISVTGGNLNDNGYYNVKYSSNNVTFFDATIYTANGASLTATLSELLNGVLVLAPDSSQYFKVQSTTSSCTGDVTLINSCYYGVSKAAGTCTGGSSSVFSLPLGSSVTVTLSGYFYSGTGNRSASASLNAVSGGVIQQFYLDQDENNIVTYTPLSYVLSTPGEYVLNANFIDCSNGSGTIYLYITNCTN
jgi:hypothetical protein